MGGLAGWEFTPYKARQPSQASHGGTFANGVVTFHLGLMFPGSQLQRTARVRVDSSPPLDQPFPLVAVGRRNATNVADYWRFDARVARRFDLGAAGELTAFFEVNNLTKRNNDCCVEYQLEDEEEEEVFLDVEPRGTLPLIPSVGVLWKF